MHQKIIFALMKAMVMLSIIFFHKNILPANLNGTVSPTFVYTSTHQVFSNGQSARGFVRMNRGFTIKPGAIATLDTVLSVSGSIDLKETGILQLLTDLKLDNNLTWSSGGYINGRQKGIILNGTLSIPASKIIHIIGDTIIDGQGNNLILSENAQIIVESNATLTLRNLTLQNARQNPFNPCLKVAGNLGKIALDNVNLAITGDMQFAQGELYIHNDVIFTGTSAFIYASTAPCFVAPSGKMLFDINTTFSFIPPSAIAKDLIILQDQSSSIYLNGSSLKTTNSGMQLTRGSLILSNKISLDANTGNRVTSLSGLTSIDYGTRINALSWHPTGKFLVIGGAGPVNGAGGFANTNEIRLYRLDGSTLSPLTSVDYGTRILAYDWHPSGQFLALGGQGPTNELIIYTFNGSTLTLLTSVNFATNYVDFLKWHPSGKFLAVGGLAPISGNELQIYSFNGTTLTALTSKDYGDIVRSLSWNPSGTILAVGGTNPSSFDGGANVNELQLYSFNGTTLTGITSVHYGGSSSNIYGMGWDPSGRYLAIAGILASSGGGFANTNELRVYRLDGSTLTPIASRQYGGQIDFFGWHPSGTMLTIGGTNPINGGDSGFANTDELRLYDFDGTNLTPLTSKKYGTLISALEWSPDGKLLAIGGNNPTNPSGDFSDTNELRVYAATLTNDYSPQAFSRSLIFGNSTLGSEYNLNVEVLGSAYVTTQGNIVDDSA